MGYRSGAAVKSGGENAFLGLESGLGASGTGNVYLGHRAGAEPETESDYNVAIGHSAAAHGGCAVAIGRGADASSRDAVALGCGTSVSGSHSVAVGPSLVTAGDGSLVIMPRRDGLPASFTDPETLNVYGVLTGFRDDLGVYNVRLGRREAVTIDDSSSRIAVGARHHHHPLQRERDVPLVATNGLRVAFGDTVMHGRAVHHDVHVQRPRVLQLGGHLRDEFQFDDVSVNRLLARDAEVDSLLVDDARVTGRLDVAGVLDIAGETVFGAAWSWTPTSPSSDGRCCQTPPPTVERSRSRSTALRPRALTALSGVFEDLTVYGETFINASGLTLAGELTLDNLTVRGVLSNPGISAFNVVQVADRIQSPFIDTSNIDNSGDASFGGDVVIGGALSANVLDCDNIECDTILVKGQNTLTVLGTSKLNVSVANDTTTEFLTVTDTCAFSNYVVGGDLFVNKANVGTLVVREGLTVTGPAVTIRGASRRPGSWWSPATPCSPGTSWWTGTPTALR